MGRMRCSKNAIPSASTSSTPSSSTTDWASAAGVVAAGNTEVGEVAAGVEGSWPVAKWLIVIASAKTVSAVKRLMHAVAFRIEQGKKLLMRHSGLWREVHRQGGTSM